MKSSKTKGLFMLTAIATVIILMSISLARCAYYDYLDNNIDAKNIAEDATLVSEKGNADNLISGGAWKTKEAENASVEMYWDSPQTTNTIILEENSDKVMDYKFKYYNTDKVRGKYSIKVIK